MDKWEEDTPEGGPSKECLPCVVVYSATAIIAFGVVCGIVLLVIFA